MARTPLARTLKQLFFLNDYACKNGLTTDQLLELQNQARLTRREALLGAMEIAAVAPLAALAWKEAAATEIAKTLAAGRGVRRHLASIGGPVIVVGAGTAGLTAAYRLTQAHVPCVMYEGSTRSGGRMYTQHDFNQEGMFCERGGELVDSDHNSLMDLCHEVGLEIQQFQETDSTLHTELYAINGRLYNVKDLLEAFRPLANELHADQVKIYGKKDVDVPTYKNPYNSLAFDQMNLRDYLYSKKNVEPWVLDLVNVCYIGEMGCETDVQSAINLLSQIGTSVETEKVGHHKEREYKLLGESDESHRIVGGSGALPTILAQHLTTAVPTHYEHELVKIADNGNEFTLTFVNAGKTIEARAVQIVLAVPLTLLRRVEGIFDLDLSPRKKRYIQDSLYGMNAKFMTGYKSRFWRELGRERRSTGLAYTQGIAGEIWETSRLQKGQAGILTSFTGGKNAQAVRLEDLSKVIAAIGDVFPGAADRYDGKQAFQHWPSYRFTRGSYSSPGVGQYNDLVGSGADPELNSRFVLAGEHTSIEYIGFMNGAVESGDRAATDVLKSRNIQMPKTLQKTSVPKGSRKKKAS